MWPALFQEFGLKIHFAHRTFEWQSEARGKAHVHVVIIGFGRADAVEEVIFEYDHGRGDPISAKVSNISPYLIEGKDAVVENRGLFHCVPFPRWLSGSRPNDGGNYLVVTEDQHAEPSSASHRK